MAARSLKGVLNSSILLQARTSSFSGSVQRRPSCIRTIANHRHQGATPDADDTKPAAPSGSQKCTCPDCRWFPFHKPNLLSTRDRARILRFVLKVIVYTPSFGGGPCETPLVLIAPYHLAGTGNFVIRHPFGPPVIVTPREEKKGGAAGLPVAAEEGEGREREDKGGINSNDDDDNNDDAMPRSGYDTTNMRTARDPRPAGQGGSSSSSSSSSSSRCEKKGGGGSHGSGKQEGQLQENNEKEKEEKAGDGFEGPTPLEKKERTVDDARIPLEGRGWTFWL